MNRNYDTNEKRDDVVFFVGQEVERTPAYGRPTLFVVGIPGLDSVVEQLEKNPEIDHIFFGANHSYDPIDADEYDRWDTMIRYFLEKNYWCTLDIPLTACSMFLEGGLCSWNRFIPQIRVPVPYVEQWNYNAMLKLDDIGFDQTNPGVWCHHLHSLRSRESFTGWPEYNNDQVVK